MKAGINELEYIKKVLDFQIKNETAAMYFIVPFPFEINKYEIKDFQIKQCFDILKLIEKVEKFSDKIKNATICFTKRHDNTETLLLCVPKDMKYNKAIDGSFHNVFDEANQALNNEFLNNITFDVTKSFHLSVLKSYIVDLIIDKLPAPPPKPFAGLLRDLNDTQLDKLFTFLTTENKAYSKPIFIDKATTDRDSFNHIFGRTEKPNKFIPIDWKANNQWLREVFAGLQKIKTYHKVNNTLQLSNVIERQAEQYFTKNNVKIDISSKKQLQNRLEYKKIIEFLATI